MPPCVLTSIIHAVPTGRQSSQQSEDQYIADFPKPENSENKVRWNIDKFKTCA